MKSSDLNPSHSKVNVDADTGCWIWTGFRKPRGYGQSKVDGVQGVVLHRASWTAANGPIPEGMTVDHVCFNPPCLNPEHLRLLTLKENSRRQRSRLASHCKHGHEFTSENTYWRPSGARQCRACNREAARRLKKRKEMIAA